MSLAIAAGIGVGGTALLRADTDTIRLSEDSTKLRDQVLADLRHVAHLKELARKAQDIVRLTCVNNVLIQLKAQANIFDLSRQSLDLAVASGGGATNEMQSASVAADGVRKLREEADGCAGERELISESSNGFTGPVFPDDPTLGNPFDPGVEPPGYASPYN